MMTLEIVDIPPSPNVLRRKYRSPYTYKKLRKSWEWSLLGAVGPHHRELLRRQAAECKVQVQVTIHHSRLYDQDNAIGSLKPVLDALKNVGYLRDDNAEWLDLLPVVQVKSSRKAQKTIIKIGVAT